jgi:hypothetical protein
MKKVLRAAKEEFADRLKASKILWLEPDIPEIIRADRPSILRAVKNFVDNAMKYGVNRPTSLGFVTVAAESKYSDFVRHNVQRDCPPIRSISPIQPMY